MKQTLGFENMNIVQNNGPIAGQTVSHFHVHLIPRYENDTVSVTWKQLELTDKQIADMKEKLSKSIKF
jgi:histidine triad (HIT) family protein